MAPESKYRHPILLLVRGLASEFAIQGLELDWAGACWDRYFHIFARAGFQCSAEQMLLVK
ncbi:MAG: DNA/RNA helicase domain-containing protein [Edaphobacter sp.]|uniref:DNA/RNA helicase domain-containing protein n=1 Tax=Edaphobacter sp. TaxID=1934404 RepID=UPI002981081D|nr:DNA/RNA helicase domain-containing protein [Edaphobacter sp.]MDW5264606.1 DNA/RNA helicase domain-containing protein [Edaphobacter sp.]